MKVLDMGSGILPDKRATDGVEYSNDKVFLKQEEKSAISQAVDYGIPLQTISQLRKYRDTHIKIIFGINYNRRLPYADNTFDLVTSMASVAAFGTITAYTEAYRVLKHNGILEISGARLPKAWVPQISKLMKQSGFKKIHLKTKLQDTGLFRVGLTIFKKDTVYGEKP
jgi:SAM-dependent methyltransferase